MLPLNIFTGFVRRQRKQATSCCFASNEMMVVYGVLHRGSFVFVAERFRDVISKLSAWNSSAGSGIFVVAATTILAMTVFDFAWSTSLRRRSRLLKSPVRLFCVFTFSGVLMVTGDDSCADNGPAAAVIDCCIMGEGGLWFLLLVHGTFCCRNMFGYFSWQEGHPGK